MSAYPDINTQCSNPSDTRILVGPECLGELEENVSETKKSRSVSFPEDDQLVTKYFEPANPWQDVALTSRAQLAAEYLEACRRHNTPAIESVLQQIRELPEACIGGAVRAPRLSLCACALAGAAPADALEAVLRRVRFARLELHAALDDDAAEAIFDMIEYYESALVVSVIGERHFGIRGWQAASRMIKKSAELTELEVSDSPLEASHAPVLARALRPLTCRLRALCLQRSALSGEPLLCLVIALKSNSSVRELRLGDNGLSPADAAQVASLLRLNTRLQLLDLSNNQIQDLGFGHIAEALVEQAAHSPPSLAASPQDPPGTPDHHCLMAGYEGRGLAFLVLWNNQLTRNCAVHLNKALRSSQSLCVLNIGRNALGAESVRALCAGGALVSVGLQAARLGPDAAPAIADLIRADTKVQRLDLRDNRLGATGLQCILAALKQNNVLTQIDLDEPTDSSATLTAEDSEAATAARLTREIRSLCGRNEPAATSPERRVHRKISLTCHTVCMPLAKIRSLCGRNEPAANSPERRVHRKISLTCHTVCMPLAKATCSVPGVGLHAHSGAEEERRTRLRSPAPSPAGSPVPAPHHSRFSVTRVTPEREAGSPTTPARPAYCPTPSRFKVVQVSEPPQIQVHPASSQPRKSNRFSVTRNYDIIYNPQDRPSTPDIRPVSDNRPSTPSVVLTAPGTDKGGHRPLTPDSRPMTPDSRPMTPDSRPVTPDSRPVADIRPGAPSVVLTAQATDKVGPRPVTPDTRPVTPDSRPVTQDCRPAADIDVRPSAPSVVLTAPTTDKSGPSVESGTVKPGNTGGNKDSVAKNESGPCIQTQMCGPQPPGPTVVPQNASNSFKSEQSNVSGISDNVTSDIRCDVAKNNSDSGSINKSDTSTKIVNSDVTIEDVGDTLKTDAVVKTTGETDIIFDFKNVDDIVLKKDDVAMKQIEAITHDLGNLIQEFKDLSTKSVKKVRNDCTQTDDVGLDTFNVPVNVIRDTIVLKKNKSESSLDSPDLEVSRLMNKKLGGSPFCDSSSSLEISGSSVESLNTLDHNQAKPIIVSSVESDTELDRRKSDIVLSTESSIESTSEITPVNSNLLNMSVSSNESVSPIIFGKSKKIHDSLSSLEASVSSLDSGRQEKVMVTSADSGIEYSLQHPSEIKEDNSSNEGTLTNNSSLKETVKKDFQDIVSPKRTSSLLDVPAMKTKGLSERMRKISWVAPSPSFHIPKPEPEREMKLPSHLEKLLSLFQHPLFSRSSNEEEKKSTSNTPPRKDSSLTSSFWSWGSSTEKEREDEKDRDSSSEATDSTLSERVQVSYVDESFSKKLDSKTPSTDTDNTLSESQTFQNSEVSDLNQDKVTYSTDDNLVQKCLVLSKNDKCQASSNGNRTNEIDLRTPNDSNKNFDTTADSNKNDEENASKPDDNKDLVRPRSFAAVLKSSGSENSLDKQPSPDSGQSVDKLSSKVIRGIKENISPENTLTSSMTNTKTLALELSERGKNTVVNTVWEVSATILEKNEPKVEEIKVQDALAPIATIEEACEESDGAALDFIDDPKFDEKNISADSGVTSLEGGPDDKKFEKVVHTITTELEQIDMGKDALSFLIYENQEFSGKKSSPPPQGSLAQELQDAEIKELLDLSPELIIDDAIEVPEVFIAKEIKGIKTSPVIPERAKLKKSNSLEDLSQEESPKPKSIVFKVPEISSTTPRDIPERRSRLRTRSGSSPKSLPESLNKPCPLTKLDSILFKKKKKVSSLGKMAKDSLLALNMSEDDITEFRRSYKLTSVESLKSLESVSEDANSQSGTSVDGRCRACLRTSQESLMSLDSITEDCRCTSDCEKTEQ